MKFLRLLSLIATGLVFASMSGERRLSCDYSSYDPVYHDCKFIRFELSDMTISKRHETSLLNQANSIDRGDSDTVIIYESAWLDYVSESIIKGGNNIYELGDGQPKPITIDSLKGKEWYNGLMTTVFDWDIKKLARLLRCNQKPLGNEYTTSIYRVVFDGNARSEIQSYWFYTVFSWVDCGDSIAVSEEAEEPEVEEVRIENFNEAIENLRKTPAKLDSAMDAMQSANDRKVNDSKIATICAYLLRHKNDSEVDEYIYTYICYFLSSKKFYRELSEALDSIPQALQTDILEQMCRVAIWYNDMIYCNANKSPEELYYLFTDDYSALVDLCLKHNCPPALHGDYIHVGHEKYRLSAASPSDSQ